MKEGESEIWKGKGWGGIGNVREKEGEGGWEREGKVGGKACVGEADPMPGYLPGM